MAKKNIYVNREYEKAFDSICKLIQGGCLNGLGWSAADGIIDDGTYEYQLSSVYTDKSKAVKHGFNEDGATWFKALRGQAVENSDAIWTSFIETVGAEYHKRYSVVEYKQQPKTRIEKERALEENKEIVDLFIKLFYPEFYQKTEVVEVEGEENKEDIYGVAMRIELSGGTGASLPVLCKVYFSKNGRVVTPISSHSAQGIDVNLAEIIPEDVNDNQIIPGENIIDTTLNAIDNLINNNEVNFADYICYSDKSDKVAVDNLLDQLLHDAVELECQRVDVLYITHITASSFLYDVYHCGKPLFRLNNGLNKALTLYCLNCGAREKLVDSNYITYNVDGVENSIALQLDMHNFGLDAEQIETIKEYSGLKNHYKHVSCPVANRGQECKVVKCQSQLFEIANGDEMLCKCKDCPYPEIVYTTILGEKKYTPAMMFAQDVMSLVDPQTEEGKVEKCSSCGRYFTSKSMHSKKCPTCYAANKSVGSVEQKQLYRKYKSLLPLRVRLGAFIAQKYCVEDDELIIFVLGSKKYSFNKLCVKEKGYFDKPQRMF